MTVQNLHETQETKPKRPTKLGVEGRKLWAELLGYAEYPADELPLVEAACRLADQIRTVRLALVGADAMVRGSQGQMVANPLWAELRNLILAQAKVLTLVKTPDEAPAVSSRSTAGRALARQRWS